MSRNLSRRLEFAVAQFGVLVKIPTPGHYLFFETFGGFVHAGAQRWPLPKSGWHQETS